MIQKNNLSFPFKYYYEQYNFNNKVQNNILINNYIISTIENK